MPPSVSSHSHSSSPSPLTAALSLRLSATTHTSSRYWRQAWHIVIRTLCCVCVCPGVPLPPCQPRQPDQRHIHSERARAAAAAAVVRQQPCRPHSSRRRSRPVPRPHPRPRLQSICAILSRRLPSTSRPRRFRCGLFQGPARASTRESAPVRSTRASSPTTHPKAPF